MLGADDGIVSTASLMLGVATASAGSGQVLAAGIAGLVAGAMSMEDGSTVAQLRRRLPSGAHLEDEVFCPWEVKGEVMRLLVEAHRGQPVDLTDGIKVGFEGGWVLVLPDPDAPRYRVVASGRSREACRDALGSSGGEVQSLVAQALGEAG